PMLESSVARGGSESLTLHAMNPLRIRQGIVGVFFVAGATAATVACRHEPNGPGLSVSRASHGRTAEAGADSEVPARADDAG
ncbi:hypothetical protein, partial [Escherichia coli]|uniref:hypothetical protein n=1 Tax=Escherichia coli TaxID=562 RepID=UPI001BE41424